MKTVFLVEDSRAVRDRLRGMLAGIPELELVGEVDNEADAVREICHLRPDLVILDFSLAAGNGLGVLRRIRKRALTMQVIMLTNYVYPQYRAKSLELGADYFLDKSCDIDVLGGLLAGFGGETTESRAR